MAKQTINIGASANDGTGTPLRTAFDYCNLNFTELYTAVGPSGNNIVVPGTATITGAATVGTTLGVTGVSTFAAGTALLPGITTTGDTNTGIFNPSADTWAVSTGGTERFRVNSTGLGVGVVPSYNLDVQGADNSIIAQFGGVGGRKVNFTTSANGAFANGYFNFVSTSSVGGFSFQNTTGTLLTIDNSGNVGVGVTPSAWASIYKTVEFSNGASIWGQTDLPQLSLQTNAFLNSSFQWIYKTTAAASNYRQTAGAHLWFNAPSGTAGNAITFAQAMTLNAAGSLVLGAAAVATTATDGFLYIPGCTGTPTGTPTAQTGRVPLVVDTTNNKLYFYSGGSWVAAN